MAEDAIESSHPELKPNQSAKPDTPKPVLSTEPNNTTKRIGLTDAHIFLNRIRNIDYDSLPVSLQTSIRQALDDWLNNETPHVLDNESFEDLRNTVAAVVIEAKHDDDNARDFGSIALSDTVEVRNRVIQHPPLVFPLQAELTHDELDAKFPKGNELLKIFGHEIKIYVHESSPKRFYLIEKPDGSRQSLRFVQTSRTVGEINQDLEKQPKGLPKLQVLQFSDGSIGLLTEWINGRHPDFNKSDERKLCEEAADTLLTIPWELQQSYFPHDFNSSNFLIEENSNGSERAYYVDSDLPEFIMLHPLSDKINAKRKELLRVGKERNKIVV